MPYTPGLKAGAVTSWLEELPCPRSLSVYVGEMGIVGFHQGIGMKGVVI